MDNKKIYLRLVILGAIAAIGGILMRFSGNPSLRGPGTILGWSGIAVLLIARIVLGRRRAQPPLVKE
jgi:hypothetical protein